MSKWIVWLSGGFVALWAFGRASRYHAAHPANTIPLAVAKAGLPIVAPPASATIGAPATGVLGTGEPEVEVGNGVFVPAGSNDGIIQTAPPLALIQHDVISSTSGVDLTKLGLVDSVPALGEQPANLSAWMNIFSSPGVYRWSLISDPSVSFLGDMTAHRVS